VVLCDGTAFKVHLAIPWACVPISDTRRRTRCAFCSSAGRSVGLMLSSGLRRLITLSAPWWSCLEIIHGFFRCRTRSSQPSHHPMPLSPDWLVIPDPSLCPLPLFVFKLL